LKLLGLAVPFIGDLEDPKFLGYTVSYAVRRPVRISPPQL